MSAGSLAIRIWLCTAPPFWARPAMSLPPPPLFSESRSQADDRADRHDAGAADAGHDDAVGLADRRQFGLGQRRHIGRRAHATSLLEPCALDRHERGAEALQAGEILVAARLVDGALAAELGLERLHRTAIRLPPAIAP